MFAGGYLLLEEKNGNLYLTENIQEGENTINVAPIAVAGIILYCKKKAAAGVVLKTVLRRYIIIRLIQETLGYE